MIPWYRNSFIVPNVGDNVFVEFENGDINRPICVGKYISLLNKPIDIEKNYPDLFSLSGFSDIKLQFDDKEKSISLFSPAVGFLKLTKESELIIESNSGSIIKIDNIGNIEISGNGDININSNGTIKIDGNSSIDISSNTNINISSTFVNLG